MPLIPFPQRHQDEAPAPVRSPHREARIHGTFRSPSGGLGTMTGWMRLERFHVVSDRLCAAGVFTGELLDSDGTTIGVGSRRRTVPAEITRSLHDMAVVIGPVDVDLLGLTVSIPAFTLDTGVVRRPLVCNLAGGLDNHQAEAGPDPAPAAAPPPGLVPAIAPSGSAVEPVVAPVSSAVALKRRYLGFVLEEAGQPR
jgi:hypothetical protein